MTGGLQVICLGGVPGKPYSPPPGPRSVLRHLRQLSERQQPRRDGMTYDEELAGRLRELLSGQHALTERKMFGGLAFLINGNMCCGVHGNELILRLGSDRADQAMEEPHVRAMDITGRPMKGWVILDPVGLPSKAAVRRWVEQAAEFAASLPAK